MKSNIQSLKVILATLFLTSACGGEKRHKSALFDIEGNGFAFQGYPRPFAPSDKGQSIVIALGSLAGLGYERSITLLQDMVKAGAEHIVIIDSVDPSVQASELDGRLKRLITTKSPELASAAQAVVLHEITRPAAPGVFFFPRDYFPLYQMNSQDSFTAVTFKYRNSQGAIDLRNTFIGAAGIPAVDEDLRFEGGNFQTDGIGNCFVSSGGLRGPGQVGKSNPKLVETFKRDLGCKTVTILNSLASARDESVYVGTNHLDMWAKVLDSKTAVVVQISPRMIKEYNANKEKFIQDISAKNKSLSLVEYEDSLQEITSILDENAATLASMGYNVIRIPVPLPGFVIQANINGIHIGKNLLLPRFNPYLYNGGLHFPKSYHDLHEETERLLAAQGYTVKWTDFGGSERSDGSFHCRTSNLPSAVVRSYLFNVKK